jgi:Zn finger protein HypA/HybF involved in hydrogenase expression
MNWICDKCGKKTERLQIWWGECDGQKVDILDYFCPFCSSNDLTFQGTKKELDAYWDMEWK